MSLGPSEPLRSQLLAICEREVPAGALSASDKLEFIAQLEKVLEQAKLESLAEFAAGAGHEINNPVATISGRAQLLLADETDPERRHALEIIGGQALRIRDMIGDTMLFARPPQPRIEQLHLAEVVHQAVASQATLQTRQQAHLSVDVPHGFVMDADRTQLFVVLSNLLRNSLEAADRPSVNIRLTATVALRNDVECAIIAVADDGPGMSPVERDHAFDPFYSGRQAGRGLGFGLSKCWRIIKMHGGQITAEQSSAGETVFEIHWPLRTDLVNQ